ncbi:hypothetical protein QT994_09760 [Microcoleus sp. S13_B4]
MNRLSGLFHKKYLSFVEQARKPVADNGARSELPGVKGNVGRSTRTPDRIALT